MQSAVSLGLDLRVGDRVSYLVGFDDDFAIGAEQHLDGTTVRVRMASALAKIRPRWATGTITAICEEGAGVEVDRKVCLYWHGCFPPY